MLDFIGRVAHLGIYCLFFIRETQPVNHSVKITQVTAYIHLFDVPDLAKLVLHLSIVFLFISILTFEQEHNG
jgi:hypothetical protein